VQEGASDELVWLDPDVAARINTMGIPPRQDFWIVKRKPAGKARRPDGISTWKTPRP
jgi:hypothetical protein